MSVNDWNEGYYDASTLKRTPFTLDEIASFFATRSLAQDATGLIMQISRNRNFIYHFQEVESIVNDALFLPRDSEFREKSFQYWLGYSIALCDSLNYNKDTFDGLKSIMFDKYRNVIKEKLAGVVDAINQEKASLDRDNQKAIFEESLHFLELLIRGIDIISYKEPEGSLTQV